MPRPSRVTQSYKKVIGYAAASRVGGTINNFTMSSGVDSVAAGQSSAVDIEVPTGAVITEFVIQYAMVNLSSVAAFWYCALQKTHSGQTAVQPRSVGGSPQRNQVFFQDLKILGNDQNNSLKLRFKVPKKYQRVREGDSWVFSVTCDSNWSDALQIIYKFYR